MAVRRTTKPPTFTELNQQLTEEAKVTKLPTLPTAEEVRNLTSEEAAALVTAPTAEEDASGEEAIDPFANIETEVVTSFAPKPMEVPPSIQALARQALTEKRVVYTAGWDETKKKKFAKLVQVAGALLDTRLVVRPTIHRGQEALGVAVMATRKPRKTASAGE